MSTDMTDAPAKPAKKAPAKKEKAKKERPAPLPLPERIAKMRADAARFSALAQKLTEDADTLESTGDEKALQKKRRIAFLEKQLEALRAEQPAPTSESAV